MTDKISRAQQRRARGRSTAVRKADAASLGLKKIIADFPLPCASLSSPTFMAAQSGDRPVTIETLRMEFMALGGALSTLLFQAMCEQKPPQDWSCPAAAQPKSVQPLAGCAATLGKVGGEEPSVLKKVWDFFQKPAFNFNSDDPNFLLSGTACQNRG